MVFIASQTFERGSMEWDKNKLYNVSLLLSFLCYYQNMIWNLQQTSWAHFQAKQFKSHRDETFFPSQTSFFLDIHNSSFMARNISQINALKRSTHYGSIVQMRANWIWKSMWKLVFYSLRRAQHFNKCRRKLLRLRNLSRRLLATFEWNDWKSIDYANRGFFEIFV